MDIDNKNVPYVLWRVEPPYLHVKDLTKVLTDSHVDFLILRSAEYKYTEDNAYIRALKLNCSDDEAYRISLIAPLYIAMRECLNGNIGIEQILNKNYSYSCYPTQWDDHIAKLWKEQ